MLELQFGFYVKKYQCLRSKFLKASVQVKVRGNICFHDMLKSDQGVTFLDTPYFLTPRHFDLLAYTLCHVQSEMALKDSRTPHPPENYSTGYVLNMVSNMKNGLSEHLRLELGCPKGQDPSS